MSWRNRKHDEYTNRGKLTVTTVTPSSSSEFFRVFQTQKYIGGQQIPTFEGVFPQGEADDIFTRLVAEAHGETVEPPANGRVVARIVDDE